MTARVKQPGHWPNARDARSWFPSNHEVYCYLRTHLPDPFRIVAEPSSSYFTEWKYHYRVLNGNREVVSWQGDFRELAPNELGHRACELLRRIAGGELQ